MTSSAVPGPSMDPAPPASPSRGALAAGAVLGIGFVVVAVALLALVLTGRPAATGATAPSPVPDASAFAYAEARPAPPLELTDQDGRPFALTSLAGRPVLVFFGYTHCPDVCPETVGVINRVLDRGRRWPARGVHLDRSRAR